MSETVAVSSSSFRQQLLPAIIQEANVAHILAPGTPAPNFTLSVTPDQSLSLTDLRGQPVVLAFYPADWSPVCGDQMALYNEILPEFQKYKAEVLGISVDGVWCHAAFTKDRHLHFPLLADFEPKGAVAKSYGAYRDQDGVCERALFVIDEEGVIFWSYCSPIAVNPGADGILEALENLRKKRKTHGELESSRRAS
jgi:peroxiredoxin